jgi:hypothetical protein
MNMMRKYFFLFFAISFLLTACKKDISVPNPEMKKLFGTWEWVESSGGISGGTITPATEGHHMTIEFKENGVFKKYKNNRRIDRMTFTLSEGSSIISNPAFLIEYKDGCMNKKEVIPQSFKFGGQDTLYLSDECYDCYSHVYVRK